MLILSNNQWKCNSNNSAWLAMGEDCSSDARSHGLILAYKELLPDVIGIQEASEHMSELVCAALRKFDIDGGTAEYSFISGGDTPILYRSDKLRLTESGFYCYPKTIEGLEGEFNNSYTKSCCYGVFEPLDGGRIFAFMSTHLWWMTSNPASKNYRPHSDEARAHQISTAAEILNGVMSRYDCAGIIAGDFNATYNSPCLNALMSDGWRDVYHLTSDRDETSGHHYCFADGFNRGDMGKYSSAIDHIMLKGGKASVKYFKRFNPEWFDKLSDHYPLYSDIEF